MNGGGERVEESVMLGMEGSGRDRMVYMWGYLPGALPQRSPLLSPVVVRLPQSIGAGSSWRDVFGGGCGFALAISGVDFFFFPLLFVFFFLFFKKNLFSVRSSVNRLSLCFCFCFFWLEYGVKWLMTMALWLIIHIFCFILHLNLLVCILCS